MKHPFKLKNAALLMALAAIYPMAAHSAAGVAQFAVGEVSVRRGAATVPLAKGQSIDSGDSIVTGSAGQAQLRFTDGGLVSLSPNSQFNIDRYADENDAGKDSFAVSFLRGGMRAITGLIGKRQRENYKVTTNTATIGIRGSAFSAKINADGTMDVAGEQDGIEVCTNAGCVSLIVGEIVRVNDGNSLPSRTAQRSNVPPLVARQDLFVPENPIRIAEITLPTPPGVVPPPPPVQPPQLINGVLTGVSAMFAFGDYYLDTALHGGEHPSDGEGTFVDSQMVRHIGSVNDSYYGDSSVLSPANSIVIVEKTSPGAGSFGTVGKADDPGFIGWGYWDAGKVTYSGVQNAEAAEPDVSEFMGVHYIVGRPTPQVQMPVTGTASYTLIGGTKPTAYDGTTLRIGNLLTAFLNVDFQAARVNATINTDFDGVAVQISGYGYVQGSKFYANGYGNGYQYGSGEFYGFFTGDQAAFAGLVYQTYDNSVGYVQGSAVFGKSGTGEAFTTQTGMSAMFTSANGDVFDNWPRGGEDVSAGTAYFVGKKMYVHHDGGYNGNDSYYSGISTVISALSPVSSFGALGNPSDANFIGWGYWARGKEETDYYYSGNSNIAGVHYIVGRPTPQSQMPVSGTAKYDLVGGTNPTAYDYNNGTFLVGQLLGAELNVDFSQYLVNTSVHTRFTPDGQPVVDVHIGGVGSIYGSTFRANYLENGDFYGYFVGDGAERAGMVYRAYDTPVGEIHGAAVFEKNGIGDAATNHVGIAAMFVSGDGFLLDSSPRGPYTGNAFFIGTKLFEHDNYSGFSQTVGTRGPVSSAGALGTVSDADFIGWGYWAKGQVSGYSGSSVTDVHYLVGRPTPSGQMPVTGTANYALAGGTAPTATMNGTTLVGSLLNTSNLAVNFGAGEVIATINTQFTKDGNLVPVTINDLAVISGSRFTGLGCGGTVSGFFTGNLAARAGVVYNRTNGTVGEVRGAAVFTQSSSSGLSTSPP